MRNAVALLGACVVLVAPARAQVTGMPAFDAPYRAFARHEAGVAVSFPNSGTAFEGEYRFGYRKFDVGFRGGVWDPGGLAKTEVLLGVGGRQRIITHTEEFPLDGALAVGLGLNLVSGGNTVLIPAGLSLGRLIEIKDSPVTITPYAEPVVFLRAQSGNTDVLFTLGLGGDVRLSKAFDLRVSAALGDLEGLSLGAVWIR